MNILILFILLALYFPMFGKIIPGVQGLPYNFVNYSILLLLLLMITNIYRFKKIDKFNGGMLIVFSVYYISNLWFKGITYGFVQELSAKSAGVFMGVLILILLNLFNIDQNKDRFYKKLTLPLGIALIFQFLISFYESKLGYTLGSYEIKVYSMGAFTNEYPAYGTRDLLLIFGLTSKQLFGLHFPFTGLIGQHNGFGTMLVFYNLLFLISFVRSRSKIFLLFLFVVMLSIIGNTTRIALLTIIISDLLTLYFILYKKRLLKNIIIISIIITAIFYASILYERISTYLLQSNTLLSRFDIWNSIINSFRFGLNVTQFLFGIDVKLLLTGEVAFMGGFLPSVENQFISIFLFSGIVGLILFLIVFIIYPVKNVYKSSGLEFFYLKLLAFSILLLAFTLDNLIHYASFVLIILTYYYCITQSDDKPSIDVKLNKNAILW